MKLSENISLEECIKSSKALKLRIENIPSSTEIENLKLLAVKCLQPIRSHFNKKLLISSAYRCYALNKAVGGAKTSQHLTGQAVDFIVEGVRIIDVIDYIRNNLVFDQLIDEYAGEKHWIHISYNSKGNRKEVLRYKNRKYARI